MTDCACALCHPYAPHPMPSPDFHPECALRDVVGGIGHLTDHIHWCIVMEDPDMGLCYRDSALLVWEWVQRNGTPESAHADGRTEREE